MQTTEYPIVSTENRIIRNDTNYDVKANIINLGICKVVQLYCQRKTNMNVSTTYTTVFTQIPNDLQPNTQNIQITDNSDIICDFTSNNGIRAKAKTSGNYNFTVTFTYVVI